MAKISAQQVKELRDRTGVGMMDAKKALVETEGDMDQAIDFLRAKGLANQAKKADRIAAEGLAAIHVDENTAALVEVNSETDFVAKNDQFKDLVTQIAEAVAKGQPADMDEAMTLQVNGQSLSDEIAEKTTVIGEKLSFRRFRVMNKSDDEVFGAYVHGGGSIAVLTRLSGDASEEVAKDVAMHVAAINPSYLNREAVPEEAIQHERGVQREKTLAEGKPDHIVDKIVDGRMDKFYSDICLLEQDFIKDGDKTVAEYVKAHQGNVEEYLRYEVGEGMEKRSDNFAEEVASQMKQS